MEIKNVLTQYRQGKLDVDFDLQDIYEVLCADGVHYKYYIAHVVKGLEIAGQEVHLSFPMKLYFQEWYDRYDEGLITYAELQSHVEFNELNDIYDYDCPVVITVGSREFEVLSYWETKEFCKELVDFYNDSGRYHPRSLHEVLRDIIRYGRNSDDVYLHPDSLCVEREYLKSFNKG